jgi:hypothetical protein
MIRSIDGVVVSLQELSQIICEYLADDFVPIHRPVSVRLSQKSGEASRRDESALFGTVPHDYLRGCAFFCDVDGQSTCSKGQTEQGESDAGWIDH